VECVLATSIAQRNRACSCPWLVRPEERYLLALSMVEERRMASAGAGDGICLGRMFDG
jgi:hypothetical protein